MKNIFKDQDELDVFARVFWNLPERLDYKKYIEMRSNKQKTPPFFALTTSKNWFQFLELTNRIIETPTWIDVKQFTQNYCEAFGKDFKSYHDLYDEFEKMGYSPVFKTSIMQLEYIDKPSVSTSCSIYGLSTTENSTNCEEIHEP